MCLCILILIKSDFSIVYIDGGGANSLKDMEIVRKEIGLEWMLRPEAKTDRKPTMAVDNEPEKVLTDEVCTLAKAIRSMTYFLCHMENMCYVFAA